MAQSQSNPPAQPYYLDFLRCVQCSCQFEYYVPLLNPMTLPMCGHSMCRKCINLLRNQSECPKDHVSFGMNPTPIDQLPVNYALLTLIHPSSKLPETERERFDECPSYIQFDTDTRLWFDCIHKLFNEISSLVKPILKKGEHQSTFNHSMVQNVFHLLNTQYIDSAGRANAVKTIRSFGEQLCVQFILHFQGQVHQSAAQNTNTNSFPEAIAVLANAVRGNSTERKFKNIIEKFTELSHMSVKVNTDDGYDKNWECIKEGLKQIKTVLTAFIKLKKD